MSIILPVERPTLKSRLILGVIYLILTLGGITMVWPFLMMVTGSLTNRYDHYRYAPIPKAFFNKEDRLMRIIATQCDRFPLAYFPDAPRDWQSWTAVSKDPDSVTRFARPILDQLKDPTTRQAWETMAADYAAFNATYDIHNSICAFDERDVAPFVSQAFNHNLEDLNQSWRIRYGSFYDIRMVAQRQMPLHSLNWDWDLTDPKNRLYQDFKASYRDQATPDHPYTRTQPYTIEPLWHKWLTKKGLTSPQPGAFPLDPTNPTWQQFIREAYPRRLISIKQATLAHQASSKSATPPADLTQPFALAQLWHEYLVKTCKTPQSYATLTNSTIPKSLLDIPLKAYENSPLWRNFILTLPPEMLQTRSPEADFQAFLRQRYPTLSALNAAYGAHYPSWHHVKIPFAQALIITYARDGLPILWHDITANYRIVFDYLFIRGEAFFNTLILVCLTILATLTVNPIAAYALSRYNLRRTESILLYLLATMAFPAAVTAIPGFILIRQLGLLNTFAALILPTVANGLSIFILKGFFDGLPRELYEAATIDGASEWQIFRQITLPMTTPILAVNALNAFITAYNSWEWALLVCQKQSHWTLSVWLYQMNQSFSATPWVAMAGFVIISIPTAIVFLLCQRIIMRGIVLPSMK